MCRLFRTNHVAVGADDEDGSLGSVALDRAEPEVESGMLEPESTRPQQQVDSTTRQEELVRVVVDVLSREVPRAVRDGVAVCVLARPRLDVDSVGDVDIFATRACAVSVAHQSSQKTENPNSFIRVTILKNLMQDYCR